MDGGFTTNEFDVDDSLDPSTSLSSLSSPSDVAPSSIPSEAGDGSDEPSTLDERTNVAVTDVTSRTESESMGRRGGRGIIPLRSST